MQRLYPWFSTIAAAAFLAWFGMCTPAGAGASSYSAAQPARGNVSASTVRNTQRQLKQEGYYHGRVDGVMGSQTRSALRQYQRDHNMPVTGRLTQPTARNMGVPTTGQYFESAGNSITGNYSAAGHDVSQGAKGMAGRMHQGDVGSGFAQFGNGIKNGAIAVGKGTAHAAEKAYQGTKHALTH